MILEEIYLILVAAVVGAECALIGAVLCLRKMVLLGDAISHAILPGVVLAFAVTGAVISPLTLVGAGVFALLTVSLIDRLSATRRIGEHAAIGVVFTLLFALGVLGVSYYRSADLDLDCVLFGNIELTPFDLLRVGSLTFGPRALWINGTLLLVNAAVLGALAKEIKLTSFDPEFAATQGFRPRLLFYIAATLAALTCVAAFEAVGVILVVAMLAVPAGAALLWCARMGQVLTVSVVLGTASGVLAYPLAYWLDASVSGCAALVAGAIFALAFLFAPRRGLLAHLFALRRARENVRGLLLLVHVAETGNGLALERASSLLKVGPRELRKVLQFLEEEGLARVEGEQILLTPPGRERVRALIEP